MKDQGLRIGNYVTFLNNDFIEVTAVFESGVHDKNYNGYHYEDIKQIPLTNEWLLSLGFVRDEFDFYENESRLSIYPKGELFLGTWGGTTIGVIESVHKLQNIFFNLSNRELSLK